MAPGERSKFGAPMFEPEIFRKQIYFTEESTCDNVGTFRRLSQSFGTPRSDSAPGELCPRCPPSLYPKYCRAFSQSCYARHVWVISWSAFTTPNGKNIW